MGSPNGDAVVSQTFVNVGQKQMVTVSLESGAYVTQQLASNDMTTRTDIVDGAKVLVSIDATTGQQAIGWQPADDRIFWVYGTGIADDELFKIVRSLQIPAT